MTKYIDLTGQYSDAFELLVKDGGQLYCGNSKEGPFTIVRGSLVTTMWPPNSKNHGRLIDACKTLGFDHEHMTSGRLCRRIIDGTLELQYKNTRFSSDAYALAKDGGHWHFHKSVEGVHGDCLEFDLKSAYMTNYLLGSSMLLEPSGRFANDNGAMENLRLVMPMFPKWLRLQFLGVITSHQRRFIVAKKGGEVGDVKLMTINQIDYGSAFNWAHKAIANTYNLMADINDIFGEYAVRMHTDSFTIKASTPLWMVENAMKMLKYNGFEVSVKGAGKTTICNLNSGIIGKKIIGGKEDFVANMREKQLVHKGFESISDELEDWTQIIDGLKEVIEGKEYVPVQLQLLLDRIRF